MDIIKQPISFCGESLNLQKFEEDVDYKFSNYCISVEIPNGKLIYNTITGCIVFVEKKETYADFIRELVELWFFIPQFMDEIQLVDTLRNQLSKLKNEFDYNTYVILTTLDCNARCFYCYEKGRDRISMSDHVASEVSDYIIKKSSNKKVSLRWFGGEPLLNLNVIDFITQKLSNKGVRFVSKMTTNGYLFDENVIKRAKSQWNLVSVQITMDGTEKIYNKRKAYVNINGSAYQRVIRNISTLLKHGVRVNIRLNQDEKNTSSLIELATELKEMFGNQSGFSVYNSLLFDKNGQKNKATKKEDSILLMQLRTHLENLGLFKANPLKKALRCNYCMADSDNSILITPDGQIGKCEHYSDEYMLGTIQSDKFNDDMVNFWKEKWTTSEECKTCKLYPECVTLKNCPNSTKCTPSQVKSRIASIKKGVMKYYDKYQSK